MSDPREMTRADLAAQPVESDRIEQLETALDDIRDACGREGSTMTPSEVSQLAVEHIATLESELAAERERSAALAVALESVRDILENAPELNPSNYDHEQACELNSKMVEACLFLRHNPPSAILAAHDAEVARKAKVEALEELRGRLENQRKIRRRSFAIVNVDVINQRIAALKAEGGKG